MFSSPKRSSDIKMENGNAQKRKIVMIWIDCLTPTDREDRRWFHVMTWCWLWLCNECTTYHTKMNTRRRRNYLIYEAKRRWYQNVVIPTLQQLAFWFLKYCRDWVGRQVKQCFPANTLSPCNDMQAPKSVQLTMYTARTAKAEADKHASVHSVHMQWHARCEQSKHIDRTYPLKNWIIFNFMTLLWPWHLTWVDQIGVMSKEQQILELCQVSKGLASNPDVKECLFKDVRTDERTGVHTDEYYSSLIA